MTQIKTGDTTSQFVAMVIRIGTKLDAEWK